MKPLAQIAAEVGAALGPLATHGHAFHGTTGPVIAIAFPSGHHAVLIRPFTESVDVSLPGAHGHWYFRKDEEFASALPAIIEATRTYAEKHAADVSMTDVLVTLSLALEPLGGSPFHAQFMGHPVPNEATYASDGRSVKIEQRPGEVRVTVVLLGGDQVHSLKSLADLRGMAAWAVTQVKEQQAELPTFHEVLYRLKHGVSFTCGGGRYSEEYFWDGTQIGVNVFDEGYTTTQTASEDDLRKQIARYPDVFRSATRR